MLRDGAAALRMLDNGTAACVDLSFADVVLPVRMTVRALAEAASARRPQLPVLFASGHASDPNKENLPDAAWLDQPYPLDLLAKPCRGAIGGAPTSRASIE